MAGITVEQALALHQAGDIDAAHAAYIQILSRDPEQVDAIALLGVVAHQRGRPDSALDLFDRALAKRPGAAALHAHRCTALSALGRLEEALAAVLRADELGFDPRHCRISCANILCDLGRYDEGAALYEAALAESPDPLYDVTPARLNLGMARLRQGELEEAQKVFAEALALRPDLAEAHYGLGLVHRARNDLIAANLAQRAAVTIDPEFAKAQLELGELDLLAGFFREGFAGYEWRYHLPHAIGLLPRFDAPAWDGGDLGGGTLFVYAEQGYGDSIMFARFLPQAAARGAKIALGVSAPLERLFQGFPGVDRLVTDWTQAAPFQAHAPISSLPRLLGVETPEAIPTDPYLRADPDRATHFRTLIGEGDGPAVGLVWAGRPEHVNDARRSIPAAFLGPLTLSGARLVSLQRGAEPPLGLVSLDLTPELEDFADLAAAIEALDLVVTVDTAAAHLAGALGKPVWILLPFAPDWRWRLDRADSDWHASATLFRQHNPGDWSSVIRAVGDQLSSFTQRA